MSQLRLSTWFPFIISAKSIHKSLYSSRFIALSLSQLLATGKFWGAREVIVFKLWIHRWVHQAPNHCLKPVTTQMCWLNSVGHKMKQNHMSIRKGFESREGWYIGGREDKVVGESDQKSGHIIYYWILNIFSHNPFNKWYYNLHLTDEETEKQKC